MKDKPALVSIVIPTYNRAHLIAETIQSVLDQTYTHWELIIVDDGSTDKTKEAIKKYTSEKISYYYIPHSGRLGQVRNYGIEKAKGDFIAFLDSDDLWLPQKLRFQLDLINSNPEASFIFGHGKQFGESAIPPPVLEPFFKGNVFLPLLMDGRFVFYVPTVLLKREVLNTVEPLNESMVSGADIDFFLRMSIHFTGIFSNEIVARIRKHVQSTSKKLEFMAYHEHIEMVEKFKGQGYLNHTQYVKIVSELYYKLGLLNLNNDNNSAAIKTFFKYVRLKPAHYKGWVRLAQSAIMR